MAVDNVNQIITGARSPNFIFKAAPSAAVVGRPMNMGYVTGIPGAQTTPPASGVAGEALTSWVGQIPFVNPQPGNFAYLGRFAGITQTASTILLVDRLWQNSGLSVTSTATQTVNSVPFPPRDMNGTSNGHGVIIGMEIVTATGASVNAPVITYTNSDGVAGRTAGLLNAYTNAPIPGMIYPFNLTEGDKGVQSIQSFTNSASMTSGSISLVAYRVLAVMESTGQSCLPVDPYNGGMVRCYDNTVPVIVVVPQNTTASIFIGMTTFLEG